MYYLILISLLFTFLFAINLGASLVSTIVWRVLSRPTSSWRPRTRSALIFGLRVAPVVSALVFILGFVLPAFLIYEPWHSGETIGNKQTVVIAICAIGFLAASFRVFASWWRTRRLVADWLSRSERIEINGIDVPAYRLDHEFPVFAVVGVFDPRLFISERVLSDLDGTEVASVIQHELGHLDAFDNLRRVLMEVCGDLLVLPIGRSLDRMWTEASEVAADEYAVRDGDRSTALNLASALIKIAKLIPTGRPLTMPAAAAFAVQPDGELLASRIRRLLAISEAGAPPDHLGFNRREKFTFWILAALAVLVPLALDTYFLAEIHDISEALLRALR
jgi:Zn-dependent protease with chaperone function